PPTVLAVRAMPVGIADAMRIVDPHVTAVLLPVVGVTIREPARVEAAERVVAEEERAAERRTERQLDPTPVPAVQEIAPRGEAAVIDVRIDGEARRAGGEHVGDQTLVPAADLVLERPAVVGTPV